MSESQYFIDFFVDTYKSLNNSSSNDIILHNNNVKELFEEKLPIALLALQFDRLNNTKIEYWGKNYEGGEGKIILENKEIPVEVTYCKTYEDSLRNELLIKDGVAPGAGPISRNNKTNDIIAKLEAVDFDYDFVNIAQRIVERIINKIKKLNYPNETILIVAFESDHVIGLSGWNSLKEHIKEINKGSFYSIYLCNVISKVILQVA